MAQEERARLDPLLDEGAPLPPGVEAAEERQKREARARRLRWRSWAQHATSHPGWPEMRDAILRPAMEMSPVEGESIPLEAAQLLAGRAFEQRLIRWIETLATERGDPT